MRVRIAAARSAVTTRQVALRIIGILVVVACLARVVHLNADPSVSTWIGYVIDEGRWSEIARNFTLFGTLDGTSNARLHLLLAPGYQMVQHAMFRLFGIDFWSARLFAAVCGILTVAVAFFALRRHVTSFALALGVVILGFETNLLAESRIALPEMPSVFFSLLAFLVLVLGQKTRWNAFIAGLIAAIAVAMKATTLMVMPVFPVIILISLRGDAPRARVERVLAFAAGFALLVVAGLSVALASGDLKLENIVLASAQLYRFLGLTTPYTAVNRFFDSPELEVRNPLLVGVWFCSWIWFHRNSSAPAIVSQLYLASGAWAAWWLIAWSVNEYLPGRYLVHWIVPATIHVMAGLSLAGRDTFTRIAATLREQRGWVRPLLLAWLVFPSAIFVSAVAVGLAEFGGWDQSRLLRRIAFIVVLTGGLAVAIRRQRLHPNVIAAFLLFPVVLTLLWLAGRELGVVDSFWRFDSATGFAIWTAIVALTFAACVARARQSEDGQGLGMMRAGVIVTLSAIFFAQDAPAIVRPSYSIRNASLALQQRFPAGSVVRTVRAESLFLANTLEFRAVAPGETGYDGIVIFEYGLASRRFLDSDSAANLVQVQSYPVTVNPRYRMEEEKLGPASIGVYRLR